jgi:predicted transcriptional regulator
MSKRFAPQNILLNYQEIQKEIQDTVNAEFTEEDAEMDLSKLSTIMRNLTAYIAEEYVNKDIRFYISKETAKEEGVSAKDAKKFNTMGHNLAKFIADCPLELFNTFNHTLAQEVKEAAKRAGVSKDSSQISIQLTKYKEFAEACDNFMKVKSTTAKLKD